MHSSSSSYQLNSSKRDEYSPPKLLSADVYATSSKSPTTRKQTDYYYNKENELSSKKNETEATLISPRTSETSTGFVAKNFNEKYVSRQRNESFSPIESPVHVTYQNKLPPILCLTMFFI